MNLDFGWNGLLGDFVRNEYQECLLGSTSRKEAIEAGR